MPKGQPDEAVALRARTKPAPWGPEVILLMVFPAGELEQLRHLMGQ
jgi:hypothetical protein